MTKRLRASLSVPIVAVLSGLVAVAALFGAWQLRSSAGADEDSETPRPARNDHCVRTECPVLAGAPTAGGNVVLHATPGGDQGALEVPGSDSALRITVTDVGARLDRGSLSCAPATATDAPACLVAGESPQGRVGEVFEDKQDSWDRVERPYVASGGVLALRAIEGRNSVVAVQQACRSEDCTSERVYAQVFGAGGRDLGCTTTYASKYSLPGWPEVAPRNYQLEACEDG